MLVARRGEDLACGVGVHRRDAEPHDQVRPRGQGVGGEQSGPNDGDIRRNVIARRQEGRAGEAAAMGVEPRQHEGAGEIDGKGARARNRQGQRCGRH